MKIKHLILIILYIIIQILLEDVWLFIYKIQTVDLHAIKKTFGTFITIMFIINCGILLTTFVFSIFILILYIIYKIENSKIKSFLNKKLF